jgi:hypothetical protein
MVCSKKEETLSIMSKKNRVRVLPAHRQHDDIDTWQDFDELEQVERIRKQPREESRTPGKTSKYSQRRQAEKEWGREFTRSKRKRQREERSKP